MAKRNARTFVKTTIAGVLVAVLVAGATCATACALDNSFEPFVDVAQIQTDGLNRDETIAAAISLSGIPKACAGVADAELECYEGRVCWKVDMRESAPDGVEYHVLFDAHDDTVVNWWYE